MTDSWADKAIDDMKESYEAELAAMRDRIEELAHELTDTQTVNQCYTEDLAAMKERAEAAERKLAEARAEALEVAAKEIERIAPTTESEEVLLPVTDDYGDVVGHFVERAGKRQRFITGDRAAAAIRALNGGANG